MHTPVLLKEVIKSLNIKPGGLYIDATVGEGGHALKIAEEGGKVLGIDLDFEQVESLKLKVQNFKNIKIVQGNYAEIERIAKENGLGLVDGVLFDLGLSMKQLEESGRGFSFNKLEEELDMRLSKNTAATAANLINSLSADELYEIFSRFSEELNSRAVAEAIIRARKIRKIEKVEELIRIIDKVIGAKVTKVYARIFQALRIAVNQEIENMKNGLKGAKNLLKKEGRIVVITFHSIEDRIVKRFAQQNNMQFLDKKIIVGDQKLSYERSAKLRVLIPYEKVN